MKIPSLTWSAPGTSVFRRRLDDLTDDALDSTDTVEQIELDDDVDEADESDLRPPRWEALPTAVETLALLLPLRRLVAELSTLVLSVSDEELACFSSVSINSGDGGGG